MRSCCVVLSSDEGLQKNIHHQAMHTNLSLPTTGKKSLIPPSLAHTQRNRPPVNTLSLSLTEKGSEPTSCCYTSSTHSHTQFAWRKWSGKIKIIVGSRKAKLVNVCHSVWDRRHQWKLLYSVLTGVLIYSSSVRALDDVLNTNWPRRLRLSDLYLSHCWVFVSGLRLTWLQSWE